LHGLPFANRKTKQLILHYGGDIMVKPLSEQLSALAQRAKSAEDAVAAAQKEAHEKVVARREESRATVSAAIDKVDRNVKSAGDTVSGSWKALKAKIAGDMDTLKANVAQRKHDRGVRRVENYAETLEAEAACSVDYAIASIEQAKLAVLDAIVGRV
jgi:cell division septum initiation protein DivIVA